MTTDTPEPGKTADRPRTSNLWRFHLERTEDVSGVSGTGVVAQGVMFHDGVTVTRWFGDHPSTAIWESVRDMMTIHGHGGRTKIIWED